MLQSQIYSVILFVFVQFGDEPMKMLPAQKTASVTKFSTLSRNQIAKFLSGISEQKVYPSTVVKLCALLEFKSETPISINEVQRIYLLACAKELVNGGQASYREAMYACRLSLMYQDLTDVWNLVEKMGGLTKVSFDEKLADFYRVIQLDKRSTFK